MRCFCALRELTANEETDLPKHNGISFCYVACIRAYTARWHEQQLKLGFDVDGDEPRRVAANETFYSDGEGI